MFTYHGVNARLAVVGAFNQELSPRLRIFGWTFVSSSSPPVASVSTLAYDDIHPRLYLHYLPLCFILHTFGSAATTRGFHLTTIQPSSILHLADKIVKHRRTFGGWWNS